MLIFISGLFQSMFGFLKLGFLAKYIPYPVLAGLLNGTAVTIIWSQTGSIIRLLSVAGESGFGAYWPSALIGASTIAGIMLGKKYKVNLLAIERDGDYIHNPSANTVIKANDILVAIVKPENIEPISAYARPFKAEKKS